MCDVRVLVSKTADGAVLPEYANPGDAGAVLRALEAVRLPPGELRAIRTGLAVALPDGFAALVQQPLPDAPEQQTLVIVLPAVVDAGFRGEITVGLLNPSSVQTVHIATGQPIARLVIVPIVRASFAAAEKLPGSVRQ